MTWKEKKKACHKTIIGASIISAILIGMITAVIAAVVAYKASHEKGICETDSLNERETSTKNGVPVAFLI